MIDDDPQPRHLIVDADDRLDQVRPGIRRVQRQVGLLQQLKSFYKGWVCNLVHQVVSPEIAVPDAEKKPVLVVTVQIFLELGLVGLKIADGADHHPVRVHDFEHPEVVFDPWAGLDLNRAHNPQRRCQLAISRGQCGLRVSRAGRIGSALWPRLVEQMDVAVDDGNRGRLSLHGPGCGDGGSGPEWNPGTLGEEVRSSRSTVSLAQGGCRRLCAVSRFTRPAFCGRTERPSILRPQPRRRASRFQPGRLPRRTRRAGWFRACRARARAASRGQGPCRS